MEEDKNKNDNWVTSWNEMKRAHAAEVCTVGRESQCIHTEEPFIKSR